MSQLLDIDLVIPIGFVLNELISNALKYGFSNKDSGHFANMPLGKPMRIILKVKDDGVGFPCRIKYLQLTVVWI